MTSYRLTIRSLWAGLLALLLLAGIHSPGARAQTTPPCDYTTNTVTLNSVGGSGGGTVRYVLTDASGLIRQVSSTPTFSGFTGSQSYTALAISYDGTATGLTVGSALSAVSATCFNWSDPLTLRVCVSPGDEDKDGIPDPDDRCPGTPVGTPVNAYGCPRTLATCDYTTTSFSLTHIGGAGGGTVRYVLADSVGVIRQISSTPTFSGLTGSKTYMALAISHDGSATGLTVGGALSAVSATCFDWSDALMLKVCVDNDKDKDGVIDPLDLCPDTPLGTPVNAYGCPKSLTICTYAASSFTLASMGGSGNGTVQYVLADSVGTMLQVNSQPVFSGLTGSKTYMVLAISHDGSVTGLTAGNALSAVSATCFDWSDAVVVRVCVPTSTTCDYAVGDAINLVATGGTTANTLTYYALVDANGIIVRVSRSPSFPTVGLQPGLYAAYSLVMIYQADDYPTNLKEGKPLTSVEADCLTLSNPLPIKLCLDCGVPRCIPITITRVR